MADAVGCFRNTLEIRRVKADFSAVRQSLPEPVCERFPELIELYWKAWELAWDHVRDLPGMPRNPYMDEGFSDTDIWIWDSCFMSLFCKYSTSGLFPGLNTLQNFYSILHDEEALPEIAVQNVSPLSSLKPGDIVPLRIHIADNPPLFGWAEYENACFHGNIEHLKRLLYEKRYLQKHYQFLEELPPAALIPGVRNKCFWQKRPLGYLWEGGRSGMDNTPRGRITEHALVNRPNNPDMLWLDAICQQALAASCIARLAAKLGDDELEKFWQEKFENHAAIIRKYYWDADAGCFYDIDQNDNSFLRILSIASFWPLTSRTATPEQAAAMVRLLEDPAKFGGAVPLVSLARDDADFNGENGMYWRGSVWMPTAYAALKGCINYGHYQVARESALKVLQHMNRTWREYSPHTIWECYNPSVPTPARSCDENHRIVRPDFCGWSALGPISAFIEFVIGIYEVDAFAGIVKWNYSPEVTGCAGIRNFSFGSVVTSFTVENQQLKVISNRSYTLSVNGKNFDISPGENNFTL